MSADAGTGASIESGNHRWNPSCADLIQAAIDNRTLKKVKLRSTGFKKPKAYVSTLQSVIVGELKTQAPSNKAVKRHKSLILLKVNAFNADLFVSTRCELKFISHIDVIPINSQEKYKKIKFLHKTKESILNTNHSSLTKKSTVFGSP